MHFRELLFICIFCVSCAKAKKGETSPLKASPVTYSIGDEKQADRSLKVVHTTRKDSLFYFAEFTAKMTGNYRGWEFTMYDERSKRIASTLRIYRLKRYNEPANEVIPPGTYNTLKDLTLLDTTEVVVQLVTDMGEAFRANSGGGNAVTVARLNASYDLITFSLSATPESSIGFLTLLRGRFLIKRD